jgi:rod shape-determining protein MreC
VPRSPDHDPDRRRSLAVFAVLVLAALSVITLDARGSAGSAIDRARSGVGGAVGPLESGAGRVTRSVQGIGDYFGDVDELREQRAALERENAALRAALRTTAVARQRAGELDRMLGIAQRRRLAVVPARVVNIGAAQTFSRTVTIDAGRRDGVRPDLTVINGDGLVGRVISASRDIATVLLVVDAKSVVGGRLASSFELGFLSGDGKIGDDGRLTLELVDDVTDPAKGDTVVTWGAHDDAPYVGGVPIGEVTEVSSSPRQLSKTAVVEPFADFSALDLVGVVVEADRRGAREVVEASR